jgi:hypothetical protein
VGTFNEQVWGDSDERRQRLADKVRRAITQSTAVLVLLTPGAYSSPYVQQEIAYALAQAKLVVPLVHPGLLGADLAMLAGVEYIVFDFENPADASASLFATLHRIASSVEGSAGDPASPPSFLRLQVEAELQVSPGQALVGALLVVAVITLIVVALERGGGPGCRAV